MMFLLWLVVEDFWARPRPAGFGSAAAAPEQKNEQFRAVTQCLSMELVHSAVLNTAEQHVQLQEDAESFTVTINN